MADIKYNSIVCVGDVVEYTFTIENLDKKAIQNLVVGVTLSDGQTLTDIILSNGMPNVADSEFTILKLNPGDSSVVLVKAEITDDCFTEFTAKLESECNVICAKKSFKPITCCSVTECVSKGELDCSSLTE